jgi:hypothetical protein
VLIACNLESIVNRLRALSLHQGKIAKALSLNSQKSRCA